jgi:DNA-binding transcriptional LysR family regulator
VQRPDLNLLVVFSQLYQDRKVSLAAQNLGLSQPTVSAALARLRKMLNDELFVRTARGMQPTPLAERIAAPLGRSLADIRYTLATQAGFDASTATRQFALAMTDIFEFHFLPRLVATLEAAAAQLSISTVRGTAVNLKLEMDASHIDLALGFLPDLVTGFHRRVLFTERYVCLSSRGHPMAERPSDLPPQPPLQGDRPMLNEHTLTQLRSLRLDGMVHAIEEQATSTAATALGFDERLTLLVQREIAWRDDRRVQRLLKAAKLKVSAACVEDINWRASRSLDRSLVAALAGGDWLRNAQNLLITGMTEYAT